MPASIAAFRCANSFDREDTSDFDSMVTQPTSSNRRTATRVPKARMRSRMALVEASTWGRMCSTGKKVSSPPSSMRMMHPRGRNRSGCANSKPFSKSGRTDSISSSIRMGFCRSTPGVAGAAVELELGVAVYDVVEEAAARLAECQDRRFASALEGANCKGSTASALAALVGTVGSQESPPASGSLCGRVTAGIASCKVGLGPVGPANHTVGLPFQPELGSCASSSSVGIRSSKGCGRPQ
mmetsp:Transcript_43819/g.103608  ORF Transcript_43819/g.103608 Transcript_43819/m.103608 type:complete len:240 (-) Transcript_43819:1886-2605(-)